MKLHLLSLAVISTFSLTAFAAQPAASTMNNTDKISYSIGVDIGHNFKNQEIALNPQMMAQGVKDATTGDKTLMTPKEMQDTLAGFQKELISKRETQLQQIGQKNKAASDAFLAENKTKPGVVTLPDGLQYKIIKEGTGKSPTQNDSVMVNYEGTFIDGKVFDSSYTRGKPVTFPVSQVIPGWTEALKMMKPGAEWMVYVPSTLGYGDRGVGPIGPNQALVFKIELLNIANAAKTS